jgi:putative flavoprotein involved in K+ transport
MADAVGTFRHQGGGKASDVEETPEDYDVVVIGAGQAGLTMGYFLSRREHRFLIVERAGSVGAAWRERWDSLTLFTSREYDSLPGLDFPGDPAGYPNRDEVIAYLDDYARRFELPVRLDTDVRRLGLDGSGGFVIETDGGTIAAHQVVVATGPFQRPFVPEMASQLAPTVHQAHSVEYRRPSDVTPGRILVVGGGNTGFQIAEELSSTHDVVLAVGSRQTPLPQRVLGRDLFWWLTKTGLINKTVESRVGSRMQHRDTLIGSSARRLRRRHGATIKPRVIGAQGKAVRFEDDSELEVDAVIWATGYRSDYSWIDLPVLDGAGRVRHRRGVTELPGLYFLGLYWQWTRGSALVGWVKDDAEYIAQQIDSLERPTSMPHANVDTDAEMDTSSANRMTARHD